MTRLLQLVVAACCAAAARAANVTTTTILVSSTSATLTTSGAASVTTTADDDAAVEVGARRGYHGYGGGGSNSLGSTRRPSYGSDGGGHYQGIKQERSPLHVEFGWKKMDFVFPSDAARREAVRSGNYNYSSIIALDVDVWEKAGRKKTFITMPGGAGVPATLATVTAEGDPHAPLLAPYPDWGWHRKGDCRSISSVYRVAIDDYDRLWVMDRGDDARCPPKIMTFDLVTDRLLSKFEISQSLLVNGSNLITPVVDVRDDGRNTFVYVADVVGGLIVYDHQSKSAWRVNHQLMLPDPQYSNHDIAGTKFYLPDGIFGLALGPLHCEHERRGHTYGHGHCEEDRTLYFHALASVRENHVKTSVLRNRDNFPRGQNKAASAFKSFENRRPSESAASAMSPRGVFFTGLLPDLALMCWNSEQPFAGWNIEVVARDPQTLQFTSGMKVRRGRLWVLSCRYQRFFTNTMKWNEVNFRVLTAHVDDLIRGTKCDPKSNNAR